MEQEPCTDIELNGNPDLAIAFARAGFHVTCRQDGDDRTVFVVPVVDHAAYAATVVLLNHITKLGPDATCPRVEGLVRALMTREEPA